MIFFPNDQLSMFYFLPKNQNNIINLINELRLHKKKSAYKFNFITNLKLKPIIYFKLFQN